MAATLRCRGFGVSAWCAVATCVVALTCDAASDSTPPPHVRVPLSTDGSDPRKWDRSLDGAVAAPGNHKVIHEDDEIRVLSVTVPAGTEEHLHLHPYYSVLVFDSLARSVDRDASGKPIAERAMVDGIASTRGPVPWVFVQPPQALHSIKNIDTVAGHLIRIEFKQGTVPELVHPRWPDGQMPVSLDGTDPRKWNRQRDGVIAAGDIHKVIFENERIRVQSVTVAPMSVEPYHLHPYPSVLVMDRIPSSVVDRDRTGKPLLAPSLPKGPVVVLQPPQPLHSVQNLGSTPLHLTRIEFKNGFPP